MMTFLQYLTESDNGIVKFTSEDSKKVFDTFNTALNNIKEKYAKCMAVVSLLDSNGGNLSEKILAYYLSQEKGITAERVGGDQDLTDIIVDVNGKKLHVSLKTYNSSNNIDLGSHLQLVAAGSVADIANTLNKDIDKYNVEHFSSKNGKERKAIKISSINDSSIKTTINKRIDAVLDKLCGSESTPEVFCYIEKIYDKKRLVSFRFNTYAFDRDKLKKLLAAGYITITNGAYGLMAKTSTGSYIDIVIAQAKNQLTISPVFLKNKAFISTLVHPDHANTIELNVQDAKKKINKSELLEPLYNKSSDDIDDAYIKSLEALYDKLITTNNVSK